MSHLFNLAIFGDQETLKTSIEEHIEKNELMDLISIAAYKQDFQLITQIHERILAQEEEDFHLMDELIYYLAYFEEATDLLEALYEKTNNSKLHLEIISSIIEIDREKGIEYIKSYLESDNLNELSIGIYLADRFQIEAVRSELIALMNRPMLEDLKYQALFTLGKLKYEKILPLLLKGAIHKNDQQLMYIEAIKNFDTPEVKNTLCKEAKRRFQDKIVKLKLAQIIYPYNQELSTSIFKKFIKSKKLDLQGYTIELLAHLKNDKFIPEVNDIFQSPQAFNKANCIAYFKSVGYTSKLKELEKFYFTEDANKNMKAEILNFVSSTEKDQESLQGFISQLPDEEQEILLKNIIDNKLKKKEVSK